MRTRDEPEKPLCGVTMEALINNLINSQAIFMQSQETHAKYRQRNQPQITNHTIDISTKCIENGRQLTEFKWDHTAAYWEITQRTIGKHPRTTQPKTIWHINPLAGRIMRKTAPRNPHYQKKQANAIRYHVLGGPQLLATLNPTRKPNAQTPIC